MAWASRTKVLGCGTAFCLSALTLGVAAPSRAEPFRFPWDPPPRPPEKAATAPHVDPAAAREGARTAGTLRAPEKARRRSAERRHDTYDDLASPGRPLPAPRHSLDGLDDLPELTPVEPTVASVKPSKSAPAATPPHSSTADPAPADAALSPIKPLHPPGAPKIEPLPQ